MDDFFSLDPAQQTFHELLRLLVCSGPRFHLRFRGEGWFPQDLLLDLVHDHDPLLSQRCVVRKAARPHQDWEVMSADPQSPEPPFCSVEDLLAFHRVLSWLEHLQDLQTPLLLQAEARQSPFLATYYRAVLGVVPQKAEWARLPVWLAVLEDLFAGLLVSEVTAEVSFATIHSWMGALASFSHTTRSANKGLDDGEVDWEPMKDEGGTAPSLESV